jgi:hypothetical protein
MRGAVGHICAGTAPHLRRDSPVARIRERCAKRSVVDLGKGHEALAVRPVYFNSAVPVILANERCAVPERH